MKVFYRKLTSAIMQKCMDKNKDKSTQLDSLNGKVALITGGAKRIGACITETLHGAGMTVVIHYRSSAETAKQLQHKLLQIRPNSVLLIQADLNNLTSSASLIRDTISLAGRLDTLVNNASTFYPTPLDTASEQQWEQLINTNLKAPFFITQAAAPHLTKTQGNVINIVDIYSDRPLIDHPIYCATKAGLASLTKSFAQSLGPDVRVNGISPGAILWPESQSSEDAQNKILSEIPLETTGTPEDIAAVALFLIHGAQYINGQIINVDGGRTVIP